MFVDRHGLASSAMEIGSSRASEPGLRELATQLGRAFLRLPDSARRRAVSDAENLRADLDVSALSRPDVDDNEAA